MTAQAPSRLLGRVLRTVVVPEDLDELRGPLTGRYRLPHHLDACLVRATSPAGRPRAQIESLSDREREVLSLLGAGLSNAEIGNRLFVVEGTVKSYVSTILSRLGVRNRVQAAVLASEAGLVPPAQPTRQP